MKKEVEKKIEGLGKKILEELDKGINPSIDIPVRSLSNVFYDEKTKMLSLGNKVAKRYFFHVAHAKSFMQTLLVAAFTHDLIKENLHTSLRDMFYALKRTLPNSKENTFDEQNESNNVLVDLEVALNVLREQLHINADVRGRVVGDVVIEDRGDTIDWSKLGSGGWAIPSNVEDIKFKKVNAKWILVAEKNAAFERLHEDRFWQKHKCILLTTQGQAARGARRLIQRLSQEFNLPVYVFTDADSIPPWEIVIIREGQTKEVFVKPIGELLKKLVDKRKNREILHPPWEILSMNEDGSIKWKEIEYVYRHKIKGKLLKIFTRGRGVIEVTPHHSLFSYKNGKIVAVKASELKEGDYLVVSKELPKFRGKKQIFYVDEILKQVLPEEKLNRIELIFEDGSSEKLAKVRKLRRAKYVKHTNGKQKILNKIEVDEDLAWLLGLWVAEGSVLARYVTFSISAKERELAEKIKRIVKEKLNLNVTFRPDGKRKTGLRVAVGSSILSKIFSYFGLSSGARKKHIPNFIFNSPPEIQLNFIKGMIDGDGHVDRYKDIVYYTVSETLAKQLSILLLSLGIMPTIIKTHGYYLRIPYTRMDKKLRSNLVGDYPIKVKYTNDPIYGLPNQGIVKRIMLNLMNNYQVPYSIKPALINQDKFVDVIEKFKIPERFVEEIKSLEPFKKMITLVKIKRIEEEEYEGDVYDFAVPGTNSFVGGNGVVFHNSYGWYIYSVIKYGSISLAHISDRLGTPNARFIGLTISDIDKFNLQNFTIRAKENDIKRAKEMLKYPWFQHPAWQKELKLMIKKKIKAELEALSGRGLRFVTEKYLPEKIKNQDFLP